MWDLQLPLIPADSLMLSVLPSGGNAASGILLPPTPSMNSNFKLLLAAASEVASRLSVRAGMLMTKIFWNCEGLVYAKSSAITKKKPLFQAPMHDEYASKFKQDQVLTHS